MNAGRNELCPCGSGKKYKKCCLLSSLANQAEDLSYRRFRDIESKLIARLYRHAAEVFGPSSIEEAWDEFHCWNGPEEFDPESLMNQAFGPYFLFSWEIDPAETDCDLALDGKTIAESFLAANRTRLSKEEIEILEAGNRPAFTFYEIREVILGQGFLVRDILTETEYEIIERTGSKESTLGSILFGAIFQINGKYQTLGMAPYILPPLSIQALIEVRKKLLKSCKTKKLTASQVSDFDIELREVFFSLLEPVLNPKMPELCNTDGDPLLPQTLHFEITDPEAAFHALKSLADALVDEDELRSDAKLKNGHIHSVEIPWFKKTPANAGPGSNIVLGRIKINGTKLTAEVNSDKRAKAIKKKIESALGSGVCFKTKLIESIEGNLGSHQKPGLPNSSSIPLDKLPPEALASIRKMAEDHWAKWYDEKIPALNGRTPKEAAKSKEGRELLDALLHSYEQKSTQADNEALNLFQPDVETLRSKLGLTKR